MRRTDREITDREEIRAILSRCRVCRIAIQTGGAPYIVPLNFGYTMEEDTLTLYFHAASVGRKLDLIAANPLVGFEVDREIGLVPGETACQYGYRYESVIGEGQATLVFDPKRKCAALSQIMRHQTGGSFSFTEEQASHVAVFVIEAKTYSAKRRA